MRHAITKSQKSRHETLNCDPNIPLEKVLRIAKVEPLFNGPKESATQAGWGLYFVEGGSLGMVQFEKGKVSNVFNGGTCNGMFRNGEVVLDTGTSSYGGFVNDPRTFSSNGILLPDRNFQGGETDADGDPDDKPASGEISVTDDLDGGRR